jgi:hypothetical protein
MNLNIYRSLIIASAIVFSCAFFFGYASICSANTNWLEISDYGTSTGNVGDDWEQGFIADIYNLSSFQYYSVSGETTHTQYIYLCKGTASTTQSCYNGGDWCNYDGNSVVTYQIRPNHTSSVGWNTIEFIEPVNLTYGENYYICYDNGGSHPTWTTRTYTDSTYPGQSDIGGTNDVDLILTDGQEYESVEIIDIDTSDAWVQVGSEDLMLYDRICISGETCDLELQYGFDHVGDTIFIYQSESDGSDQVFVASTTLPNNILLKYNYVVPDEASSTTEYYIIYDLDKSEYTRVAEVKWMSDSEFTSLLDDIDYDSVCSDIATTSDGFWDGVRYGIECGFRKLTYWAFTVKPSTYVRLDNAKNDILQEIPFNLFAYTKGVMEIASSTATSTFEMPIMWLDSETNMATMTLSRTQISDNFPLLLEKFLLIQKYIFYLVGFYFIIITGLKLFFKGNQDDI